MNRAESRLRPAPSVTQTPPASRPCHANLARTSLPSREAEPSPHRLTTRKRTRSPLIPPRGKPQPRPQLHPAREKRLVNTTSTLAVTLPQRIGNGIGCRNAREFVARHAHDRPPHLSERVGATRVVYTLLLAAVHLATLILHVNARLRPAKITPEMTPTRNRTRLALRLNTPVHLGNTQVVSTVAKRQAEQERKLRLPR